MNDLTHDFQRAAGIQNIARLIIPLSAAQLRIEFQHFSRHKKRFFTQILRRVFTAAQHFHDVAGFQYGADAVAYGFGSVRNNHVDFHRQHVADVFKQLAQTHCLAHVADFCRFADGNVNQQMRNAHGDFAG